jgi:adenylosuccinate synthase
MGILEDLIKRAENSCELCKCENDLDIFEVSPSDGTEQFPFDLNDGAEAQYVEMPGWKTDMTKMQSEEEFPEEFNAYLDFLERELEVPIKIVSVGPDRAQTIIRYND